MQRVECEILNMLANMSQSICEFFRLSALNFGVAHVSFSLYPDGFLESIASMDQMTSSWTIYI